MVSCYVNPPLLYVNRETGKGIKPSVYLQSRGSQLLAVIQRDPACAGLQPSPAF